MNAYTVALFLHVVGAIGYFVGMGLSVFGLFALRGAQRVEQVRTLTALIRRAGPFMGMSVLLLLVSGLYMAVTAWGLMTSWILVALISLVVILPVAGVAIEPRRRVIARLAQQAPDGPVSTELRQRTLDPVLLTATQTVTALLLGIVFLMTNKPELGGALIVMVVALVLGLASGPLVVRQRRRAQSAQSAGSTERGTEVTATHVQQPVA
jgi:uncharacterized membrane protein